MIDVETDAVEGTKAAQAALECESLSATIGALPSLALEDLPEESVLLTRTDRKYVVSQAHAVEALRACDGLASVSVGGQAQSIYKSVYFDTPEFQSFHDAATGRRHRFKVRIRTYLDSGQSYVEVKVKTGRGDTEKTRIVVESNPHPELNPEARGFVASALAGAGLHKPDTIVANLIPTITTTYARSTLLGVDASRVTIDTNLRCEVGEQTLCWPDAVLVETKAVGHATALDRILWRQGHRPVTFSKFAVGMTAFNPGLPHNKWHRIFGDPLLTWTHTAAPR